MKNYPQIVKQIGLDNLIPLLPRDYQTRLSAWKANQSFNAIPLAEWDRAGGWREIPETGDIIKLPSPMHALVKNAIGNQPLSVYVCILKEAAYQEIQMKGDA